MGQYAKSEWYLTAVTDYLEEYGDVPPPWIVFPTYHPVSMGFRMGNGETHIMIMREWLEQQKFSKEEMIEYYKKYNPPPRWLEWVSNRIWNYALVDAELFFQNSIYPQKLKELGFEGIDKFQEDFEDEKWD